MASLFDHIFDNDWRQREDIQSLKTHSSQMGRRMARRTGKLESRIEDLENQVGELALLCRSLLTLFRKNGTLDPGSFQAVMQEIDAEDGVIDGKITLQEDPKSKPKPKRSPRRRRSR